MLPEEIEDHYPPIFIERYYLQLQRQDYRERQWQAAFAGGKLEDVAWLHDGPVRGTVAARRSTETLQEKLARWTSTDGLGRPPAPPSATPTDDSAIPEGWFRKPNGKLGRKVVKTSACENIDSE